MAHKQTQGRLLVADDEAEFLLGLQHLLSAAGYHVDTASNGNEALALLKKDSYDAILSDIAMPGKNGIELLRGVREQDADVPVILMTGGPAVETAMTAMEHGALRYLVKPVEPKKLLQIIAQAVLLNKISQNKRQALQVVQNNPTLIGNQSLLQQEFSQALASIWIAFQPIVSWKQRKIYGYEALVRSNHPNFTNPAALISTAEQLQQLTTLGRIIRQQAASFIEKLPHHAYLFINLHTLDLADELLYDNQSPLVPIAKRVVLEITERTALDEVQDVSTRIARLRQLGFRIAVDDLGAGYAGLSAFAQLEPEVVKLDMSLVRDVHKQPTKQKLIATMVSLCEELKIKIIAEGIETQEERDTLATSGIDLMQGYLFGKPQKQITPPNNLT